LLIFFSICLFGFAADILTKSSIFATYFHPYQPPIQHWWIDGILGIETTTNPGALFGMFAGYRVLFAGLSIVALICIAAWLFVFGGARDRWLTITLAIISGGILGNLYDRLGFGYRTEYPTEIRYNVRDWIHFRVAGISWLDPWPNFNVADSLLVCGAILLVLHSLFGPHTSKSRSGLSAR
jgi:signal peptidase II